MDNLPIEPGTYALILTLKSPRTVSIGKLGEFTLLGGYYLYLGSAYGPGGLRARLGRHLRGSDQAHWHIDELRQIAAVAGWGYTVARVAKKTIPPVECQWSQLLAGYPSASIPVPKFGASDCRSGCPAHLIYFPDPAAWRDFPNTSYFANPDGLWRHGGSQC